MNYPPISEARIAILKRYEMHTELCHKLEYLIENNPDPANHVALCDAYDHAFLAANEFMRVMNITRQEINSWKKKAFVRCNSVSEAISAMSNRRVH